MNAQCLHLLCIEDDDADLEALRGYTDILGWTAIFARNGIDGYALAKTRRFDVIVTDQNMPGLTGLGLIKVLREGHGPNAQTPVMLNSHSLTPPVLLDAERLNVETVVAKPLLLTDFKNGTQRLARGMHTKDDPADQADAMFRTIGDWIAHFVARNSVPRAWRA